MDDKTENEHNEKPEDQGAKSAASEKKESKVSDITDKIPDISSITSKFDLDKILGGIKSMISPEEGASVSADPNDVLGMKIEQLTVLMKELSQTHAKLAKDSAKANDLLVSLFKDLDAVRNKK